MTTQVSAGRVLARAVGAEWTRLWTVRGTWWFLAAAAAVMLGIGTIAGLDAGGGPVPQQPDPAWQAPTFTAMPAQFALLALALSAVTADYVTRGIVPTLQWTPRRSVLFLARAAVAIGTATGVGVLLGLGSGVLAYAAGRPALSLPAGEGVDVLGTIAFVFAGGTALAVGLGFLLRNTAGGLVSLFLLMVVLPLLLPQFGYDWTSALAEVLPGSGAAYLLLGEVPGMSRASSALVLLGWAGAALLLGWQRLLRDDADR